MNPAPKNVDVSTYSGRFAARLRELREKAGLTTDQMVEALAKNGYIVAKRTYYNWESARSDPPFDSLPYLAKAVKQPVRNLVPEK